MPQNNQLINGMNSLADSLGNGASDAFERLGSIFILFFQSIFVRQRYDLILEQMILIGIKSMPIVMLASTFTGFITAWQVKYLAGDVFGMRYLGTLVIRVVLTELGPTLLGLVLAGRIAAKLAAEVGTMRVTEQIDAMICLSLNPIQYIISPRVIAGIIMVPVLFVFGCIAAIISAQVLGTVTLGVPVITFYNSMKLLFSIMDIVIGLLKSCVFGGIISLCGCYFGYYTTGGAVGVGQSVRRAVVAASILILVFNLIISQLLV
jgi:phospholipid/cholesterol/gamma-HCH transport system permease protein